MVQPRANFMCAMADDHDDVVDATFTKIVDAAFDDGFVSEGEKGLERAHALGLAGGEKDG
jgi:hypothetical protein